MPDIVRNGSRILCSMTMSIAVFGSHIYIFILLNRRFIGVVSHKYDGSGGAGMKMVVDKHAGQSQEGLVACRGMLELFPV